MSRGVASAVAEWDWPVPTSLSNARISVGCIVADLLECRHEWIHRVAKQRKRNVLNADVRMLEPLRLGQRAAVKCWAFGSKTREYQLFSLKAIPKCAIAFWR